SMVGAAYAAVPLYTLFCQVTGYGGTTQRVEQYSDTILDRKVAIRFDANTNGVPWTFEPVQREVSIRIGETTKIHYTAHNNSTQAASGKATFNVTPDLAGAYFNKVECFCFTDTTLQPGETLDMPVVFFVDPAILEQPELKNIKTITLSYTFFRTETEKPVAAAADKEQNDSNLNAETRIGG
ncbi:cytochrome c oxidase assembly protein, partial [Salmonella enterica subsp. enterica serovar Virchow]|nr:cytochrome c oxidase assembly protein [Salmonella enterica subsp. enterica serovar Virchow]